MRIKRVEIIGFKSFHDKTLLAIDEPITAVVGPNGCGKSNIVDAVRWCMGEQSAKHLRGKAMEDVIFGGSESRGPAGMAEVSLTFEDIGVVGPIDHDAEVNADADADADADDSGPLLDPPVVNLSQYGEVTVTRRLFRDGGSEYYLNKTPCRLRDITDFFLGTGVGTKAYSIIEQGRVGMIVSAKADERRMLIEEAAGITKFKKKKQAAEKKMEQTRQNLLRVSDILAEIDKQLTSLRRQAQKAERYKRYRAEVRDIELWSASHRFLGLLVEEQRVAADLGVLSDERDRSQHAHDARDAEVVAERAECATEERRLADLTQTVFELDNRVRLLDSQIDYQQREARGLDERAGHAEGEIEVLQRRRAELGEDTARAGAQAERLAAEADARATELHAREAALVATRDEQAGAQAALDAARADIARAQADIARHEGTLRSAARRREDLELRRARLTEEAARAAARLAELHRDIGTHDGELGSLRQLRFSLDQERGSLEARLAALKTQNHTVEAEVEALRTEHHRRRGRHKALREIAERYEGFARGTRAVMRERPGGIRGLLADVVQAPPELEPAVEAVLGDRLGSILVDSHDDSTQAIDFLKRRAEGRSSFVALAAVPTAGGPGGVEVVEAEGVRGPLTSFVRCPDEYSSVADVFFADVMVVDTLPRALELWHAGLRRTLVTLDGDIVDRSGVVTGGSRETAGASVLAQKRELRELDEICAALERDLADATARQVAVKAELARVGGTLDALRKDSHEGDITIVAHEKDLLRLRAEAERLAERRANLERENDELGAALVECGRDEEEAGAALAGAQGRADDAERRQLGLIDGVTGARAAADDAAARVTEAKVMTAETAAAQKSVRAELAGLEEQEREVTGRCARLERDISDGRARAAALRAEAAATAVEVATARDERRARGDQLQAGRAAYDERMAALQSAEVEVRALRHTADRLAGEVQRLELRLAAAAGDRRHVAEAMAERYRVDLRWELGGHHLRPPIGEPEEARLRELRELIERMGEVNLTAVEEYEELARRNDVLAAQKKDLVDALDQLERAIARINKTSRRRFRDTFDAVNAKFQEIFPRLFRGGHAELRLTAPEGADVDVLEAGVEIFAQPPGKKNSTVELLSGGEKALTAVSLIFAIFLYKPSPFCILDEVDAPLDEANVGRFNDLVREMTERSQFILITHNKRTMEIADSLYGVTMEEPGCSKMVTVNLRALGGERRAA